MIIIEGEITKKGVHTVEKMELDRMFTILEALDEGNGVALDILSKDDLAWLTEKYDGSLYLCMMEGTPAIRMNCK